MSLSTESNTDLAFDTSVFREYGSRYSTIATQLRTIAKDLDTCLTELKNSGWTTPAGTAFHEMVQTNWKENMDKYADLLDTLKDILDQSASRYDGLVESIEKTKL